MKKVILSLLLSSVTFASSPGTRWITEFRDLDAQLFGQETCEPIQRTKEYINACRRVGDPIRGFYVFGLVENEYGQEGYCGCIRYR